MGTEDHPWAVAISFFLGWTYFLLWSASFYPQPIHNFFRHSTSGLSIDFPVANVLGMTCYTLSNGLLLFNPVVRAQYAKQYPMSPIPTVALNDFVYALHGALCVSITLSQFIPGLWRFKRITPAQRPSTTMMAICSACVLAILASCFFVGTETPHVGTPPPQDVPHWDWSDVVNTLAGAKVFLTAIKYTPQVLLNWRRRSTDGFKIDGVIMDAVGSVLSLAQLVVDATIIQGGNWGDVTRNPGKFGLGNVSLVYNAIFLWQHFVAYRGQLPNPRKGGGELPVENEESPLLGDGGATAQDTAVQ